MSIKDEALRLIGGLPDDCTWADVMRAAAAGSGGQLVAVTESAEEIEALFGRADLDVGGWCVGPIPIDLSQAPAPLAEVMIRVRDAVERCLETVDFNATPPGPDPRKMN